MAPSSSFVRWSNGPLDSSDDSDILLSFSPSFSSLLALEFLLSLSPTHGCFPPGGEAVGGEGTGLEWERFGRDLVLMVC